MTLNLLNTDNHCQIIVSLIYNNITKEVNVNTESASDEQLSTFKCTAGYFHYSFFEALFNNLPPVVIKGQDAKLRMTTTSLKGMTSITT